MPFDKFSQRKKTILSKQDKSSKGDWDEKIKSLCERINKKDNCFTTSSFSGRIVLMVEQDKKSEGLFRFVSHDLINVGELKGELNKLVSHSQAHSIIPTQKFASKRPTQISDFVDINSINMSNVKSRSLIRIKRERLNIKFKQESCILHVACRNLEDAFYLLDKARKTGWKRSGIISEGKGFVVELVSTEKLGFPIIHNGKIIVDDNFLKIIIKKSNENLKKSWNKIKELEKLV